MLFAKDLAQLGRLVAQAQGWPAAKAFKSAALGDAALAAVSQSALGLLQVLPAATSAQMSAALAVQLERVIDAPVQVVAGTLAVERAVVLGTDGAFDAADVCDPAFGGHAWLMVGETIIDIALFRLAYSAQGPARLARHVDLVFGPGKALFVDGWKHAARLGLSYRPQIALTADAVTLLMGQAHAAIVAMRT
jgi:hypothetical protein